MTSLTFELPEVQKIALAAKAHSKSLSAEQRAREVLEHDLGVRKEFAELPIKQASSLMVAANSQGKEQRKISRTVNNADDLNWLPFPRVSDYVLVEIPESVLSAQEFVMVVADSW
jgi:hypothetical protein